MYSLDKLTLDEFELTKLSRTVLEEIPLKEAAMLVRQGNFSPYHTPELAEKYNLFRDFSYRNKRLAQQFSYEMEAELGRLHLIRHEFYSSKRLIMSANVLALVEAVRGYPRHNTRYYLNSHEFVPRMIRKLNNDQYETWKGYSDDIFYVVDEFLKAYLTEREYTVFYERFGLRDGTCTNSQDLANMLGLKRVNDIHYFERNGFKKLRPFAENLEVIVKIK